MRRLIVGDTQIQSFIMWMVTLTRPMKKMNAGRKKPGMPGRSAWTGVRKIVISIPSMRALPET